MFEYFEARGPYFGPETDMRMLPVIYDEKGNFFASWHLEARVLLPGDFYDKSVSESVTTRGFIPCVQKVTNQQPPPPPSVYLTKY